MFCVMLFLPTHLFSVNSHKYRNNCT